MNHKCITSLWAFLNEKEGYNEERDSSFLMEGNWRWGDDGDDDCLGLLLSHLSFF